jgi:hypothetical protein
MSVPFASGASGFDLAVAQIVVVGVSIEPTIASRVVSLTVRLRLLKRQIHVDDIPMAPEMVSDNRVAFHGSFLSGRLVLQAPGGNRTHHEPFGAIALSARMTRGRRTHRPRA